MLTVPKEKRIRGKDSLELKNLRGTCPDQLLDKIKKCSEAIGRTPSVKDFVEWSGSRRHFDLIQKTFGTWVKAKKMVGMKESKRGIKKGVVKSKYSDEELLEYLQMFKTKTGNIPTTTDCERGLLPNQSIYFRRFGGIAKARELAGIYEKPKTTLEKVKKLLS